MRKRIKLIYLAFGLLVFSNWGEASDTILIQIHLFQGIWTQDQAGLKNKSTFLEHHLARNYPISRIKQSARKES